MGGCPTCSGVRGLEPGCSQLHHLGDFPAGELYQEDLATSG